MATPNLGLTGPTVGADADTWGNTLNADLDLIDLFAGKLMGAAAVTVASGSTCDIGAAASTVVAVSGTTTITSFGTTANCLKFVLFTGVLTLTHNATSLILPRAADIKTATGDLAIFFSNSSHNWACVSYLPAGATLEQSITSQPVATSLTQVCAVSLTPGKWRLSGNIRNSGVGGNTFVNAAIGATAASASGTTSGKSFVTGCIDTANGVGGVSISGFDVTVTSNTFYYLNAAVSTTASNCDGYLRAERII